MVRVAGLKRRINTGLAVPTNIGRTPHEVLADISKKAHELQTRHGRLPGARQARTLRGRHIHVISWDDLDESEREHLHEFFSAQIFPVLMPLAVDPAHPFPYISGLSLNLSVVRNAAEPAGRSSHASRCRRCCTGSCASTSRSRSRTPVHRARGAHRQPFGDLFPGMEILDHHVFRVTRNETSRSRRTRPRTSSRRSRRSCCAAGSVRPSASRSPTTWTT